MRTERQVARCFGGLHAHARLEPLAVLVDQRDQRHRRAAKLRGRCGDVVVERLRRGVENVVTVQRGQTVVFVGRWRCTQSSQRIAGQQRGVGQVQRRRVGGLHRAWYRQGPAGARIGTAGCHRAASAGARGAASRSCHTRWLARGGAWAFDLSNVARAPRGAERGLAPCTSNAFDQLQTASIGAVRRGAHITGAALTFVCNLSTESPR